MSKGHSFSRKSMSYLTKVRDKLAALSLLDSFCQPAIDEIDKFEAQLNAGGKKKVDVSLMQGLMGQLSLLANPDYLILLRSANMEIEDEPDEVEEPSDFPCWPTRAHWFGSARQHNPKVVHRFCRWTPCANCASRRRRERLLLNNPATWPTPTQPQSEKAGVIFSGAIMSKLNNAMITIQLRMAMMTHDFGMKTTWGNYPTASTGPGLVRMPFFDANDPVQCKAAMGFGLHEF